MCDLRTRVGYTTSGPLETTYNHRKTLSCLFTLEEPMRVRLSTPIYNEESPAHVLDPNTWYEACESDTAADSYDVKHGQRWITDLPASLLNVRQVPDNEWENLGLGPMADVTGGRPVPLNTPLVECPVGHQRRVTLTEQTHLCEECERSYGINWERPAAPGRRA